jgi:hypothetical protein
MQTRAALYAAIGLHDCEALGGSIAQTIIPEGVPQGRNKDIKGSLYCLTAMRRSLTLLTSWFSEP